MKTDAEIKEWIDSREAFTQNELSKFIHGYKINNNKLTRKWWAYVLETKDWTALKDYRNKKNRLDYFERFYKIYKKDKRLQECGCRKAKKILKELVFDYPNILFLESRRKKYDCIISVEIKSI